MFSDRFNSHNSYIFMFLVRIVSHINDSIYMLFDRSWRQNNLEKMKEELIKLTRSEKPEKTLIRIDILLNVLVMEWLPMNG